MRRVSWTAPWAQIWGSDDFDGGVLDRIPVVDGAETGTRRGVWVAVADVEGLGQAERVVLDGIEQLEPLGVGHGQRELQVGELDGVVEGRVQFAVHAERLREAGDLEGRGDAAAPGRVGAHDIDRSARDELRGQLSAPGDG